MGLIAFHLRDPLCNQPLVLVSTLTDILMHTGGEIMQQRFVPIKIPSGSSPLAVILGCHVLPSLLISLPRDGPASQADSCPLAMIEAPDTTFQLDV